MEIILEKRSDECLSPCLDEDREKIRKLKKGTGVRCKITRVRNYAFHKKFFALIGFAYECWEPDMTGEAEKDPDQFRKDLIIEAGYYRRVRGYHGEMKVAKSISFDNMGEEEFEKLYDKVIDVLIKKVLKNYSRGDIDRVINELISFT